MATMSKPRVVKFSGGRSSGMMLLQLLRQKKLNAKRGDVVVFNNTSAEHPATYAFARKMKKTTEEEYNIPFFWIEYQTYEDASRDGFQRYSSYRLVNSRPYSAHNQNGYYFSGEVFEEMVSQEGFVPNMQNRSCTLKLKIIPTNQFLADWFAQNIGIVMQGINCKAPQMSNANIINAHSKNGGSTPDEVLLRKKEYVRYRPHVRQDANWQDFTKSKICIDNAKLKSAALGGRVQLFGSDAIAFVSYLGIRKDEEIRIAKIKDRITAASNGRNKSLAHQPPGEQVIAPLVTQRKTQKSVADFWNKENFDLRLPINGLFSNCVYCPLKGKNKLLKIANTKGYNGKSTAGTPAAIGWWVELEKKYSRNLREEKRPINSDGVEYVGFFGAAKELVYGKIQQNANSRHASLKAGVDAEFLENEAYMSCNCTD